MKIKNRFLRRERKPTDMSLQITSMADIFTIILVFLLKSFSTGVSNLTPNEIVLPEGRNGDEVTEMLKIEIGPKSILVDDKPVTKLEQFEIIPNDFENDGTPRSLNTALVENKEKDDLTAASAGESAGNAPGKVVILADQKTPYGTLKAVLHAAANSGYTDFKLAVVEDK